jgi:UDP-GlcNAc:undecaprenyl-phosphate GlcNAc-1-phosphate transferase
LNFIGVFLAAVLLSSLGTLAAIWIGRRRGMLAVPGGRRQHGSPVPRIGGLGIFIGFLGVAAWLYIDAPLKPEHRLPIAGLLAGTVFVFMFGLADDRFEFRAGPQLAAQIIASLIAIATTVWIQEVTLPIFGLQVFPWYLTFPLTVFWVVGMMNTVNFLDGLDGLAGGVAAIAALLFAVHMAKLDQPFIALYAVAFAGACIGFLPFNFGSARIFLGSAGAMVVGYALAALSILAPARVATALLVMAVPIADTAWQIFGRWRRGQSPFRGDRGHLHFRLVDAGWPAQQIVPLYWAFCAVFGILSLLSESRVSKLLAFGLLVIAVGGVLAALARARRPPNQ